MRRFKEARLNKNIKLSEAAKLLGVTQPTISSWESERKSPTVDMLIKIAELYNVTCDYLLGKDVEIGLSADKKISADVLSIYNAKPVWLPNRGWALVNAADKSFIFSNGAQIEFSEVSDVILVPNRYCDTEPSVRKPIPYKELEKQSSVWLEPISKDYELLQALRGRYRIRNGFAENDCGNRFPFSSYEITWLAFEDIPK